MIDFPTKLPVQQEQVISKQLVDCGLDPKAITVKYEDYLQSIEIVIRHGSRASENIFPCIHRAADYEIVNFEDPALQSAYTKFTTELYRPHMIAEATSKAEELGLLNGFPKRSDYRSLEKYARAIELHSGNAPGSVLKVSGESILFDPPRDADFKRFSDRYSKILAAIMYASAIGDMEGFGFIGNEAMTDDKKPD